MNCRNAVPLIVGIVCATTFARAGQLQVDEAQDVARVERGLLMPVAIAGSRPRPMTLQSRMQHYHISMVSIAFFDASGIRWARAYGARTDTIFQAGSVSKPVSAFGIMRLVQEGTVNLDENVNQILRGWKLPETALTVVHPVVSAGVKLTHPAG
jgi:CubicO group peptidase (beta-lactamase class C family)